VLWLVLDRPGGTLGGHHALAVHRHHFMLELTHDVNMLLPLLNAVVVAHAAEPFRAVVYRMAETGYTRLPVVEQASPHKVVGMISLSDLLMARRRNLEEEQHRERAG
jgi:CBS domain containing-hemolysin-like protein